MNRDGFVRDLGLWVVLLFIGAVVIVIGYFSLSIMTTALLDGTPLSVVDSAKIQQYQDDYENSWDYAFLTIMVASVIGLLILSWVLASNPGMFFLLFIIVMIFAGLAGYLANAWDAIMGDTVFSASVASFPIMDFIIGHYLSTVVVTGLLMLLVFFAKPGGIE